MLLLRQTPQHSVPVLNAIEFSGATTYSPTLLRVECFDQAIGLSVKAGLILMRLNRMLHFSVRTISQRLSVTQHTQEQIMPSH
jgi:hypothetical protein